MSKPPEVTTWYQHTASDAIPRKVCTIAKRLRGWVGGMGLPYTYSNPISQANDWPNGRRMPEWRIATCFTGARGGASASP